MDFKEYVNKIANELQRVLTANVVAEESMSFVTKNNYYIRVEYKNRTYALTPHFCKEQFSYNKTIEEAVNNGLNCLREAVIRDFGIGQLVDFQNNKSK